MVFAAVVTAGVWTGSTKLDSEGFNLATAIPGTVFVFALVFWTAGVSETSTSLPKNLLALWIGAALFSAGLWIESAKILT